MKKKKSAKSFLKIWWPVILMMLIAALIKLRWNSYSTYVILGGDGPYYPLQVRSMMKHLHLALPDMPLLFALDALIAKMLCLFHIASPDNCVLLAIIIINVFVPPLAAIPVFLIVKELKNEGSKILFQHYLIVAFSILNFTTLVLFPNSQLNKNAVAMVFVFWYLLFLIRILKYHHLRDFARGFILLITCAFIHFGSFTILLSISFLTGSIWLFRNKKVIQFHFNKTILFISAIAILLFIIFILDPDRILRLLKIPLKVFEAPLILFYLKGEDPMFSPLAIINLIPINLLAAFGMFVLISNRKFMDDLRIVVATAMITLTFFFSSPIIGIEWASRLFMMSYVPLTILYIIIFNTIQSKRLKAIPAVIFSLMVTTCIIMGSQLPVSTAITNQSFAEFKKINNDSIFTTQSIVTGRQDIRLLSSWCFKTKSSAEYLLTQNDLKKYDGVFIIKQIKGSNLPPARFRETAVPSGSINVFKSEYFEVYQLNDSTNWNFGNGKPTVARGIITDVSNNSIELFNSKSGYRRTVCISKNTSVHFNNENKEFQKGMYAEVWGSRKVFSLNVDGNEIEVKEIPK